MINYYKCCYDNNIHIDRLEIFSKYVLVYSDKDIFLIKSHNIDIDKLFRYFKVINFVGYIYPIKVTDDYELYRYYSDCSLDVYDKAKEIINTLVDLHTKSYSFFEYSPSEKEKIYDLYNEKIDKCFSYYLNLQDSIEEMEIIKPSYYLLLNNVSKFYKLLNLSKNYLDKFYNSDNNHYREALLVGNTVFSNFSFSDKKYFIDWDESRRDLLVWDFIFFYKENYKYIDAIGLYDYYNSKISLSDNELNLFFTIISIPEVIDFSGTEFTNTIRVRDTINYVDTTLSFMLEKNKEYKE